MQDSREEALDAGKAEEYPSAIGYTADLELRVEFQKILRRRDNIGQVTTALARLRAGEKILGLETRFSGGEEEEGVLGGSRRVEKGKDLGARRKVVVQDVPQIPLPPEKRPEEEERERSPPPSGDPEAEPGPKGEAPAAEGQGSEEEVPTAGEQGEEDDNDQ